MAFLLQLIILGIIVLIGFQIWNAMKGRGQLGHQDANTIEGSARDVSTPGKAAASSLKDFEDVRAALKAHYPATFSMLGGYLNSHTINDAGSVEGAVRDMIADWKGRSDEVSSELTKLLAENETEEECRAVVVAACDASFDEEGYRAWLTWLLGQFNEFN
ncbi:MAG: hypothetical protein AAGD92_04405 [Pseudomonadota bacterium]